MRISRRRDHRSRGARFRLRRRCTRREGTAHRENDASTEDERECCHARRIGAASLLKNADSEGAQKSAETRKTVGDGYAGRATRSAGFGHSHQPPGTTGFEAPPDIS